MAHLRREVCEHVGKALAATLLLERMIGHHEAFLTLQQELEHLRQVGQASSCRRCAPLARRHVCMATHPRLAAGQVCGRKIYDSGDASSSGALAAPALLAVACAPGRC